MPETPKTPQKIAECYFDELTKAMIEPGTDRECSKCGKEFRIPPYAFMIAFNTHGLPEKRNICAKCFLAEPAPKTFEEWLEGPDSPFCEAAATYTPVQVAAARVGWNAAIKEAAELMAREKQFGYANAIRALLTEPK